MATNDLLSTALVTTGVAPAALPQLSKDKAPVADRFARRAGPDVSYKSSAGVTEVYAVFSVDPESRELRVAVVDHDGRVLRMIPPGSIAQMMEQMARYRAS